MDDMQQFYNFKTFTLVGLYPKSQIVVQRAPSQLELSRPGRAINLTQSCYECSWLAWLYATQGSINTTLCQELLEVRKILDIHAL